MEELHSTENNLITANNQLKLKVDLMDQYIQLLEGELRAVVPYARLKGYQTSKEDVIKGKSLRGDIYKNVQG